MVLARVLGNVVATRKDAGLFGVPLLVIQPPKFAGVATPSSAIGAVMQSATAFTSDWALPMATPQPAHSSISMSLMWSPIAMTSSRSTSRRAARISRPVRLLMPLT